MAFPVLNILSLDTNLLEGPLPGQWSNGFKSLAYVAPTLVCGSHRQSCSLWLRDLSRLHLHEPKHLHQWMFASHALAIVTISTCI